MRSCLSRARRALFLGALLAGGLAGCGGSLPGRGRVLPLAHRQDLEAVRTTGVGPEAQRVAAAAAPALAQSSGLRADPAAERAFLLKVEILESVAASVGAPSAGAKLLGNLAKTQRAGTLLVQGVLSTPDGRPVGRLRLRGAGPMPGGDGGVYDRMGETLGRQMGVRLADARQRFVERQTGDERVLLTPSELTLRPGALLISNDEALLFRAAMGVSPRVQLQLWLGGFPVPGAIGGAVPAGGIIAGGAGGLAVFGFFDLGIKVKILDEKEYLPGLSLSYDLLDLFGAGIGGGGVAILGKGAAGAGFVAVGGANIQFNLFALTVGKHFGPRRRSHLVLGAYLLDNHHLLPQTQGFRSACGAGGVGAPGVGGDVAACGNSTEEIARIPLQGQVYLAAEQRLGQRWTLAAELLPRAPFRDTVLTTGARLLIGPGSGKGLMGSEALRVRLGLALLWVWAQDSSDGTGGTLLPLPWLSLGVHFQGGG